MTVKSRLQTALGDRYRVEGDLGEGGMAFVFLARDLKHTRQVAIKVLKPELASEIGPERFHREVEIAASLNHPHILPLYDSGNAGGLLYYVMPYVRGETLRARMDREGPIDPEDALVITREVADGLEYAHELGVVHRDIKPENILLSGGHALVADFGIARLVERPGGGSLTGSDDVIGTPAYMSPEQAGMDGEVGPASDLYSLACVTYEMLAAEPPFKGSTAQAVLAQHIAGELPSLRELRPDLPDRLIAAVERSLSRQPGERHPTARAFAVDLETAARGREAETRRIGGRRRWLVAAVALMVGAGVWGLAALLGGSTRGDAVPSRSFIVQPHRTATSTGEEEALALELTELLSQDLSGWQTVRAVTPVALAGLSFDLGYDDPIRGSLEESFALARVAGVRTVLALTVDLRGDTVEARVVSFDVESGEQDGVPLVARGPADGLHGLALRLANSLLDLGEDPRPFRQLRLQSHNLTSIQDLQEGIRLLNRWRLEEAEERFRDALAGDSALALGHHYLAVTLYWRGARDDQRHAQLGGEIRRATSTARRYTASVPYRDSLHIAAFHQFQQGSYDEARDLYHRLIATDSTDTYAWLLLGSVETEDPVTVLDRDGVARPRGNMNEAVRAFRRTVRLSPDFFLGYGHLFDIYRRLSSVISQRAGMVFAEPGWEPPLPGEVPPVERRIYLYPAALDSIVWLTRDELDSIPEEHHFASTGWLLERSLLELERWAAYAPDNPRPHAEMARWLIVRRQTLALARPRFGSMLPDSLARAALSHQRRAIDLLRSPTPEQRILLGVLELARDSIEPALALTEEALAEIGPSGRVPAMAVNPFHAAGRILRAAEVAARAFERSTSIYDGPDGRPLQAGVDPFVARLRVYGAAGYAGPETDRAFEAIEQRWQSLRYTEEQRSFLRSRLLPQVDLALALGPARRAEQWLAREERPTVWRGLLATEQAGRQEALQSALAERPFENRSVALLTALLAQRAGDHEAAIRLLEPLIPSPPAIDHFDPGWGARAWKLLLLARSYRDIGDGRSSHEHYRRFLSYWSQGGPEVRPLIEEARSALARSPEGGPDHSSQNQEE